MGERYVVIADDDALVRELLAAWLEKAGFTIDVVRDGVELIALLEREAARGRLPDIVVSDVRMPRLDGISVLAHIATRFPALPVLVVTATDDARVRMQASRLRNARVVNKPCGRFELTRAVDRLLSEDRE
jgi:two-component system response regulator HydG